MEPKMEGNVKLLDMLNEQSIEQIQQIQQGKNTLKE
jgi:hypothetical protein